MKTYGKIILIGEHSVVYNHKAIAVPFKTGFVETKIKTSKEWRLESRIYNGLLKDLDDEFEHLKLLIYKLKDELALPPLKIQITSTLPISSGLGSSAAVAASVTKALYEYQPKTLSQEDLFEYVQFSERIAHGVSSGIDTLITTSSKGYIFSRDGEKEVLKYDLDAFLVIGNSKEKGSTKLAVLNVKEHVTNQIGKELIDNLGKLALDFYDALKEKDVRQIGSIMNQAEENLKGLGLETKTLREMINDALQNGALGSKLTGAGLGGCVIALAPNKKVAEKISNSWQNKGFDSWIMDMKEAV